MNKSIICEITPENLETGTVKFTAPFRDEEGMVKKTDGKPEWYGYIVPDKTGPDVKFHWHSGFQIRAGAENPVFTFDKLGGFPKPGSKVVFLRDCNRLYAWGYLYYYEQATLQIAHRPVYHVVTTKSFFKGQFTPSRCGNITEVARGTMEQLQDRFPRKADGSENDPLGKVYRSGPCRDERKWQRLDRPKGLDVWVDCADPRPVPVSYSETMAKEGGDKLTKKIPNDLDEVMALAESAGGRNRGVSHPKPKPADAYADPNIRAAVARC